MKKITVISVLTLGILLSGTFGAFETFAARCTNVRNEVLRLHIPANSNSTEDQQTKLELRDYVLERFGAELNNCVSLDQAENRAEELLPEIDRVCNTFLKERGCTYGAKTELVTMYFTTREYDRLILPSGEYRALRITLGSGEGNNWWCVIFPQLCLPAVSSSSNDMDSESAEAVLNSFGKPQKVTVKFAFYELIDKMING